MTKRTDSSLRIIVTGLLAQYPLGGVGWDYLQYPVGLARAGHDVYYMEDTGQWPYDPTSDAVSKSCEYNVAYLSDLLGRFGMADRWAYRFAWGGQWFGMDDKSRHEIIRTADVILNVSGTLRDPASLDRRGVLCYLDTDPVFTQVKLARGQQDFRALVDLHDVHFSFGELVSEVQPTSGHQWLPTRQPIVMEEWAAELPDQGSYTTVMNWTSYNSVEFAGRTYGQKDVEFRRFIDLPSRTSVRLEVALASGKNARAPVDLLRHRGWHVVDPSVVAADLDSYRRYLVSSRGEWSVAKNGYVVGSPGWFSCRSACYLAAGRPVVAQDTGFSRVLPVGDGLFSFDDLDGSIDAISRIEDDYTHHSKAAREIAAEYFDSTVVLTSLLGRAVTSGSAS